MRGKETGAMKGDFWTGWNARSQFLIEHQAAHSRSWLGVPIMICGGLLLGWCLIMFSIDAEGAIRWTRGWVLILLGLVTVGFGWWRHKRETVDYDERVSEFEGRWLPLTRQQSSPEEVPNL